MIMQRAVFYMIISVIAFAVMNALVKYLTMFSVYQIVFFRSIGTIAITVPLAITKKVNFFGKKKKFLLLRGVLGVISLTCFFQSLNYLSIGTAVSLRYLSPIFAAIFALFFLKEKIKPIQWLLFFIAFVGVLIIKGFGVEVNSLGLLFVSISAITLGLIFIVIRKIGNSENPLVIINYFMIMALLFGGFMSINNWITPNANEWLLLLSLGIFGYFGQLYLTKAFQSYETSVIAPFKYLEVIFTMLIGMFWFQEAYNWWTVLGICLIFLGLSYNLFLNKSK
jgi:drug/metabolite transporter (DMT)-like permease